MLQIYLPKKIQKKKFHDFIHALGDEVGRGYRNKQILKFATSSLLISLT